MNAGDLIAVLPISLPQQIRDLTGKTSGKVDITGLPNNAQGSINLSGTNGTLAGQPYETLKADIKFDGTLITASPIEMTLSGGTLGGTFTLDRKTSDYKLALTARSMPVPVLIALLPKNDSIPVISGTTDLTFTLAGNSERAEIVTIEGNGKASGVTVGESNLGEVTFNATVADKKVLAKLTIGFNGNPQNVDAVLDISNKALPIQASTVLNNSPLDPLLAFIPQLKGFPISGSGSGRITVNGELVPLDANGDPLATKPVIRGRAEFTALDIVVQDTRLVASEPVLFNFDARQLDIEKALFAGGGSNVRITGIKAFADDVNNDLAIDGRVSLNLLNLLTKDTFFAGLADVAIRLSGPNATAKLYGSATTENASLAAFVGNDRLTLERVKSRIIFSADQADIEEMSGYIGGGRFSGSGGAAISGATVSSFRLSINGTDVTVPLPADFITTGDARLEITGQREAVNSNLQITIGGRVYARRSVYSKDIDLANVVGGRRERAITSGGGGSISPPRFDLIIEGRDALVVKNNIADLTASVSLTLTGDANEPRLSGRISANSGTIFFRKDRYVVQRGVLEFPPDTFIDPVLQLQGETEIAGYQVFVTYNGPLKDSELAVLSVRSSPALAQADVISLITTGNLTNSAGGIPTLAQSGINTAAEILTDSIINNPARKATDKLFGLNVFEIDPLISGQQANPSARLTVGRQVNNNLRVTYSTNLSQDQNQVLALEYRVSNKLSLVAQYEQRSLTNVTRNRDSFNFEVRFRKRF
jgi:translocation and assembly module TamB